MTQDSKEDASFFEDIIITVRRNYKRGSLEASLRVTGELYEDMIIERGQQIEAHIERLRKRVAERHRNEGFRYRVYDGARLGGET